MKPDIPHHLFSQYKYFSNQNLVAAYNILIEKKCVGEAHVKDRRMHLALIKCVFIENNLDYSSIFSKEELGYIYRTNDYAQYISSCENDFLSHHINTSTPLTLFGNRLMPQYSERVPHRSRDSSPLADFLMKLQEHLQCHSILSSYRYKVKETTYQSYIFNDFPSFDLVATDEFLAHGHDNRIPTLWAKTLSDGYSFDWAAGHTGRLVGIFVTPEDLNVGDYAFRIFMIKGGKAANNLWTIKINF